MRNSLGDKARLLHILDAIKEIETYIAECTFDDFSSNSMMKYAVVKQLEIIGESARSISKDIKSQYSDIDWKAIIAMRNILVHEYFGINERVVWQTAKNDLPSFKARL